MAGMKAALEVEMAGETVYRGRGEQPGCIPGRQRKGDHQDRGAGSADFEWHATRTSTVRCDDVLD